MEKGWLQYSCSPSPGPLRESQGQLQAPWGALQHMLLIPHPRKGHLMTQAGFGLHGLWALHGRSEGGPGRLKLEDRVLLLALSTP